MFEGKIKVVDREIPRTLLGTSPFVAAAQFGHRARLYQLDLYNNPENMLKIIKKSYEIGIRGIQVIPFPPVVKAVGEAIDNGFKMDVVGTVRPDKETEDIEILSELGASSMLLHAVTTDKKDWDFVGGKLQEVKDANAIPGLVTHMPFQTTSSLMESPIIDLFNLYMVPVNKLGYLMDCDTYGTEERIQLHEMIVNLDKTIIGKKILAAGILQPEEAFNYLKSVDFIDIIALGIASENEAYETFNLLTSI
jgi:hypothetical protein